MTPQSRPSSSKANDTIALLVKDTASLSQQSVSHSARWMIFLGLAATPFFVWLTTSITDMPPRTDYFQAITSPVVLLKQLLPLLLAIGGGVMMRRSYQPSASQRAPVHASIWIALGVMLTAIGFTLLSTAPEQWSTQWIGQSRDQCLLGISLISLPLVVTLFTLMKSSATTQPHYTGFALGLCAAGIATVLYATLCIEDSPLFYGSWYSLAIIGIALLSAALAPRILRW